MPASLVASLPWYEVPGTRVRWDRLWRRVRDALMERGVEGVPETLDRETPLLAQWCSERLVLSQCCGSDLFLLEPPALQPVARPVFSGLDCEPGDYYSYIAAPVKRYATVRAAINNIGSRSGHLALAQWLAARRHDVAEVIVTGSHAASLEALRRGDADIAAIDAFSWRVVDTRGVETLGRTDAASAPPFVRHVESPVPSAWIREALQVAIGRSGAAVALQGAVRADPESYRRVFEAGWEAAARFPSPRPISPGREAP